MFQHLRALSIGLSIAATLCATGAAEARTVAYRERGSGAITDFVGGRVSFAAEALATHIGRYSIEGSNDVDEQGNVLNGEFDITTRDGSTMSGIYSGTVTPLEDGTFRFDVTVEWQIGTGRLEGMTGEGTVSAILGGITPGSALEYTGEGFLVFPDKKKEQEGW